MKKSKNRAAAALGKKGGRARAKSQTSEQLSAQGRMAVEERWRRYREKKRTTQKAKS